MTSTERIHPYRAGDEEAINRGFTRVFGVPRSVEEWRWKFPATVEGVGGGRRILWLEDDDGEAAAHFAVQPVPVEIDGETVAAGHAVDIYSDRRRGLARQGPFVQLVHAFYERYGGPEGLAFLYGFPGHRHFRLGVRLLGYSPPRPVGFWRRDFLLSPGAVRHRFGVSVERGFDRDAWDRLWSRSRHRYPVAARRDGAWAARRFTGRPGVDYAHLRVRSRRRNPAAVAVLRLGDGALRWADLVWDGVREEDLEILDRGIHDLARSHGLEHGHLWLDGDPEAARVLLRRGWVPGREPAGLSLGAVALTDGVHAADVARRLYVTMADADLT